MDFNQDELELLRLISELKPYDVMQIAINQNGTRMSVTIKNNAQISKEFRITHRITQFIPVASVLGKVFA